jgi:hypothetical protein
MHSLRRLRQKHRRLTGRVGPSDDDDLIADAERLLHESRAVVHTGAFELLEIHQRRLAVSGARGDDHRASGEGRAVVKSHTAGRSFVYFMPTIRSAFFQ